MRGRPSENVVRKTKYTLEFFDYPSKPELGSRSVWHYDRSKNDKGPWKTEYYEAKGTKQNKIKIENNMLNFIPTFVTTVK